MYLRTATIHICLALGFATSAFAQLPLTPTLNMGKTGGVFADPSTDVEMDGPHTPFEKLEQRLAASMPHVDSGAAYAPGVVSTAELRHPISRAGVNLIQQAEKYASKGKHEEAIAVLKKALEDSSAAPYVRGFLGIEYLKTHDLQSAILHLKEAILLQPTRAANYSNLGYALCLSGDRAAGERAIREAIKIDRYFSKAHFLLGVLLLDDPTPEARDQLLLVENDVSLAHLALAVYYARRGDNPLARQELVAYSELNHSSQSASQLEQQLAHLAILPSPTSVFGFPPAQN